MIILEKLPTVLDNYSTPPLRSNGELFLVLAVIRAVLHDCYYELFINLP
ncbi:hypothetical protein [Dendronalium sp. ChiSLP03b]